MQGLSGGLCGLASLYQALENTILSVSELTQFKYAEMRAIISEEMGTNSSVTASLTDATLLDQYHACKCKPGLEKTDRGRTFVPRGRT